MINQVVIDGYIGKELELKTTQSLKKYVAFTICQNRYSKIQQDYIGEWHHVIAWNKVAENLVAKVHKGLKVILAGEQRTRSFIDKNGNKVAYEYIWVNSFDVLTSQNEESTEANKKDKLAEEPFGSQKEVQLTDADLPF